MNNSIVGTAGIIKKSIIQGWFYDKENINEPVGFDLYINDEKIAEIVAKDFRSDVQKVKNHPTGMVGFQYDARIRLYDDVYIKFKNKNYIYQIQKGFVRKNNIEKRKLCIVHIGMHKTGSSSIQYNLSRKKYEGFSYFELGSENHSIPIYSFFTEHPERYHIHLRAGRSPDEIRQFNKRVERDFVNHLEKNKNKEVFVISGEDISVLSMRSLRRLNIFLSQYFHEINIFSYVRAPSEFISSAFQERVKGGSSSFDIKMNFPKYKRIFKKFDAVFGEKNVKLVKYDPSTMIDNDVTSDFLSRIGFQTTGQKYDRVNESLSLEAVSLFYSVNRFVGREMNMTERERLRVKLIPMMQKIGNRKFLIHTSLLNKIMKQNMNHIRWMEKRLNESISNIDIFGNDGVKSEFQLYNTAYQSIMNMDKEQQEVFSGIIGVSNYNELLNRLYNEVNR